MESFFGSLRRAGSYVYDVRVLYLLAGIILSLIAHEFVHVLMHFGSINSVHFFPNLQTVVAIDVKAVVGYNVNTEEMIAYAVTAIVQLITIIDVLAIHDSRDKKTAEQLLFGKHSQLSESDSQLLLQIVSR